MINNIIILGSTGSIGSTVLNVIKKKKNFKVSLITTNKNVKKILKQAILYNVKNVIVEDENEYKKFKIIFKRKKINLYLGINNLKKIVKSKVAFCVNSISGIDGLEPTLDIIPNTKNILIANKESIICGWNLIHKQLIKYKTNFIPIDSEHFSIWELIKNENSENIKKIILTASGGPFLNMKKKKLHNIKPSLALKHPNWKMGKKISIDSSTMMNKIFEFIEAKKIFNLSNNQLSILIHPSSFVHAIVFFKGNLIKLLAHETTMSVPISNALGIKNDLNNTFVEKNYDKLNYLKFLKPNDNMFPLLSLLKVLPNKNTLFETILITLNDTLVKKYLNGSINYNSIQLN